MNKIREMVPAASGLGQACGRSAWSCGIGRTTASEYVERIEAAELTWPPAQELSETELHALLLKKAEPAGR